MRKRTIRLAAVIAALLVIPWPAFAQPNGTEICGDGTTFTVQLPGVDPGIDDSDGLWINVDVPDRLPDDSVTLPNGCDIYAILVSGFNQNPDLDSIIFYKVAEYVAQHNGYFHVSWWNNFMKEYMGGPLHPADIVIRRRHEFHDEVIEPSPGDGFGGFAPGGADRPKANPDEDKQFQNDAKTVIRAIRERNPDALIVVAGHSMGGGAVARLGTSKPISIDLLAPIDPVNNRDKPKGQSGSKTYNWTRWRATHEFQGYKQWDCVRSDGVCRDFDSRPLFAEYRCEPAGDWLDKPPIVASRAPLRCGMLKPYVDPGTQFTFRGGIRRLYHRWQFEYVFPFDYEKSEYFGSYERRSDGIFGKNYQEPIEEENAGNDPDKTCKTGVDPRDSTVRCDPTDGHGEVVGYRGPAGRDRLGVALRNISSSAEARRSQLINLGQSIGPTWHYRPENPDLCMVCDDMIDIIEHLRVIRTPPSSDTAAPTVAVTVTPGANENGWNALDVVIDLDAEDEANGSGVAEIQTSLSGAQPGGATTAGDAAQETIAAEGTTTISYFARDHAGNAGNPETLELRIDRTPPDISAHVEPPANANGWHRGDVTVSFTPFDALSGVAVVSDPVVVASEGADQEIIGTADDLADNSSSATAIVNIDRTPPSISAHLSAPPNAGGWHKSDVLVTFTANDALSGVAFVSEPVLVSSEGGNQPITGLATDAAGNTASTSIVVNLDKTPPVATCSVSPSELWPPNNTLRPVTASVSVTDVGGSGPDGFTMISVASNEGRAADIIGFQVGTPDLTGALRATRSGAASGRRYSLTYEGRDVAGNTATCSVDVLVPHDQGRR